MMELAVAAAWLALGMVAINALAWPRVRRKGRTSEAPVSILIPARDEESTIGACLEAAAAQGPSVREVLVYDDHSTDRTAELVRAFSARDARVRVIEPAPLPEGWKGKPFACSQLAAKATSDWLLFVDADATLAPGAVPHLVHEAESRAATLVSFWPGIVMGSAAEKWLMPLLNVVVFTLFPAPLAFRHRWPSLGLAHGACMLFRADAYRRTGGHALVAAELFEDTALARVWRERGELSLCLDGQDVTRVRMYRSLAEMWRGFQKNCFPAFRTRTGFWGFVAFHFFVFVLPLPWAAGDLLLGRDASTALVALALGIALRLVQCARFRYPVWSAALHAPAEAVLVALAISSWWALRSGRGVEWKGRRYGAR